MDLRSERKKFEETKKIYESVQSSNSTESTDMTFTTAPSRSLTRAERYIYRQSREA